MGFQVFVTITGGYSALEEVLSLPAQVHFLHLVGPTAAQEYRRQKKRKKKKTQPTSAGENGQFLLVCFFFHS